jgi:hypothetical protein
LGAQIDLSRQTFVLSSTVFQVPSRNKAIRFFGGATSPVPSLMMIDTVQSIQATDQISVLPLHFFTLTPLRLNGLDEPALTSVYGAHFGLNPDIASCLSWAKSGLMQCNKVEEVEAA